MGTEQRPSEDRRRRRPSASQGDRPKEKPALPTFDLGLAASRTVRQYISAV